jgi:hypothetical protein
LFWIISPIAIASAISNVAIFGVSAPLYFKSLSPIIGPLLSALAYLSIFYYIVIAFVILNDKTKGKKIHNGLPKGLKFIINLSLVAPLIILFDTFLSHHILSLISTLSKEAWLWFVSDLLLNSFLIVCGAFIISNLIILNLFRNNEEKFAKQDYLMILNIKVFMVLGLGFIIALFLREGQIGFYILGKVTLLVALALTTLGIYLLLSARVNRHNIEARKMAHQWLTNFYGSSISYNLSQVDRISKDYNPEELLQLDDFISIFGHLDLKTEFIHWLLNSKVKWSKIYALQQELINIKREPERAYINIGAKEIIIEAYLLMIIKHLENCNFNLSKAKERVDLEIDAINKQHRLSEFKKKERQERVNKFFQKAVFPFTWLKKRILHFFGTLIFLWNLFNQICPTKMEKKVLR